jgi:FKBP12-rapamycin complex-associated protein
MLLSACLDIVKTREKSSVDAYRRIFEEARSGLSKTSSTDVILGSLLAFGAMLQNQQIVSALVHDQSLYILLKWLQSMAEYYKSICELTLKYRDSKEVVVRKAVITLIPSMATYDSDEFEVQYLHRSMQYLLQALAKPTDRDIGQLLQQREVLSLRSM